MEPLPAPLPVTEPQKAPSPRRSAPFEEEPGFHEPSGLWFYGNIRLLHVPLACVSRAMGSVDQLPKELEAIELEAENLILASKVLVCGIHNPAHQRAAIVPLRWGSPRVVVVSGGFHSHFGAKLNQEPFRTARLWRYEWDPKIDLAVSRRAPDKKPTFSLLNATVDRLIAQLARGEHKGICSTFDSLTPCLRC